MADKIGLQCRLFYGPAGALATSLVTKTREVTLNIEAGDVENTCRGDDWESFIIALFSGSCDFVVKYDPDQTAFEAIRAAFFSKTPLAFAILDGVDGKGLDADFSITKFSIPQPLKDLVTAQVTIKPNTDLRAPVWKNT